MDVPEARPLRVLMTTDTVGGVWQHSIELARALAGWGHRVVLAALGPPPTQRQRAEAGAVRGLTLQVHEGALEWMHEPWDEVRRAGEWLLALARRLRPDVVHLNQFAFGALPFDAPTLVVAHSCVLSWWQAVHGEAAPAQWDRYRAAVRAGLEGASAIAAPTQAMLAAVARHHGVHRAGHVLPNGRNPRRFVAGTKRPLVLSAGRLWDPAKNLETLRRAASALPAGWEVRVAGPTRGPDGQAVDTHPLCALGPLPPSSMARAYAAAAVYCLPARYEPFGQTVLEAALSGCALVLGDIDSLRETWEGAAVFVPPGDAAALGDALVRLLADEPRRRELADAARERALQFTPARMAGAYLGLYQALRQAPDRHPPPTPPVAGPASGAPGAQRAAQPFF
ncbi:glycosyltransferase family 4 protein [uncultured Pseudacidovorax sp.]|uniref:glycosyltransferase family 4 protein n=1 Tax=uncultured Pseudacidovorax sp. TaxID=679313 RepID=UPI0025EEE298|nr:glycosyltransferase family 4 protein [uncultured Pseudacidovorax sp.]